MFIFQKNAISQIFLKSYYFIKETINHMLINKIACIEIYPTGVLG